MHVSMHIRRQLGRPLPHLVLAAIVAFALSSIPGDAQPAAPALSQSPSLTDLISLQEIRQEEFEPAIGEQIRSAYDQALHNTRDAEVVGRLGMILQCYGKYEPAEICYRRAWGLALKAARPRRSHSSLTRCVQSNQASVLTSSRVIQEARSRAPP